MTCFDYHFLSDVLAGAWVGIVCSLVLYEYFLFRRETSIIRGTGDD